MMQDKCAYSSNRYLKSSEKNESNLKYQLKIEDCPINRVLIKQKLIISAKIIHLNIEYLDCLLIGLLNAVKFYLHRE